MLPNPLRDFGRWLDRMEMTPWESVDALTYAIAILAIVGIVYVYRRLK